MIGDLVLALEEQVGRVELRGLVDTLRRRWKRLTPGPRREATAADGKVLAHAVERHASPSEIEAAAEVARRWHWQLMGSDEIAGRPTCSSGCPDRLVLVNDAGKRCALCDAPVTGEVGT